MRAYLPAINRTSIDGNKLSARSSSPSPAAVMTTRKNDPHASGAGRCAVYVLRLPEAVAAGLAGGNDLLRQCGEGGRLVDGS